MPMRAPPFNLLDYGVFVPHSYPGPVFKGAVTEIRKAPINVQNVITYDVVISLL